MIILKKAILSVLLLLSTSTVAHAVQVLPRQSSAGEAFGKGFGDGFSAGMERALAQKERERERAQLQKEQDQQVAREKAILDEILKDYEPSKNATFVLKILQSELSPRTKEMVVNALNEQHKMYLNERAKR